MAGFSGMVVATFAIIMFLGSAYAQTDDGAADQVESESPVVAEVDTDMGMERIETNRDLDNFTAIRSCLPFNVLVSPASDNATHAVVIEAEPEVSNSVFAAVDDGVLVLGTSGGFNTTRAIKLTVIMPKNTLTVLENRAAADLVVSPGFEIDSLNVLSGAAGVGRFIIVALTADQVTIENGGAANVFVDGAIRTARISASGTGTVYVVGMTDAVEVDASSIATIILKPASDTVNITGQSSGLARIMTTQGRCDVIGGRLLFPACSGISETEIPSFNPTFSCGLIVDGIISCDSDSGGDNAVVTAATGGSSVSTASATGPGATSTATATATGTGSSASAMGISSEGTGPFALVSTGGASDADAVAVAPQVCTEESLEILAMIPDL